MIELPNITKFLIVSNEEKDINFTNYPNNAESWVFKFHLDPAGC